MKKIITVTLIALAAIGLVAKATKRRGSKLYIKPNGIESHIYREPFL